VSAEGFALREARPRDATAIARVHVDSWRAGYHGLLPDKLLDELSVAARTEMWRELLDDQSQPAVEVAVSDAEVVGFVTYGPARDSDQPESVGEVYALYVAPSRWSRGAGSGLLAKATDALRTAGMRAAVIWLLDGNDRAARFYERAGWAADGGARSRREQLPDTDFELRELRYRRHL
jgi:GNAT superfamily N-acetyltransferase